MLDVDLRGLIARECGVDPAQFMTLQKGLELRSIQEIAVRPPLAEEQPGASRQTMGPAMMEKGPERRDAGAGTDHHDRRARIRRQAESRVGVHKDGRRAADVEPIRKPRRSQSAATPAAAVVAHRRDRQVYLVRESGHARGDRIEAGLQGRQQIHNLLCVPYDTGIGLQQVDDVLVLQELA